MAKLSRIHFAGMGNASARFNPLTLDFRGANGAPAHSVLWLRNGGGKTTMLSLFYSVILPAKREWLGKFHDKPTQLSDYMADREVGYIIIEFAFANGSRRIVGQSMVKRSADEVSRLCFTCLAQGPVTLESLPVVGLGPNPAKTREAFFDHLEAENRQSMKSVELVKIDLAKGYGEWERHLVEIGIDPAVYRSHLVMNSDEGGLGEFFNFKTSDRFLEKLLEMADEPTALPDDADGVDQAEAVVDKFRSKILGMPELEKEARFCQQLADGAKQYRVASEAVAAAGRQLQESKNAAAKALFSVRKALLEGEEKIAEISLQIKKAVNDQQEAESIINTHTRYQQGYERLGTQLRRKEAEEAQRVAKAGDASARQELALLLAAEKLAELDYWKTEVRTLKKALDDLLANRRPEIAAVENLGTTLWKRLDERVTIFRAAIDELERVVKSNQEQIRQSKAKHAEAGDRLKEHQRTLTAVTVNLINYERERRALRESGLTEEGENAPEASARWQAEIERIAQQIAQTRTTVAQFRVEAKQLRAEANRQTAAAANEVKAAEAPRNHLRIAGVEESELRSHRLVQQHGGNSADLHNPGLLQAIQVQIDGYSVQVLSAAVGRAADERILSRHAPPQRPVFPVPLAIERVLELLRAKGVRSALPRYEWIAANCGLGEAERLLRENPAAAAGIMLQDPSELTLVTPLASAEGIDAPVSICVAGSAGNPTDAGHVIIPAERGYFNVEAAAASRGLVQERVNTSKQDHDRLIANRIDAERAAYRLQKYAATFGVDRLRQLKAELDGHEANAASQRALAQAAESQAESKDELANAGQDEVTRLTALSGQASLKRTQVDKYIIDYHNRIEGWRALERTATEGTREEERILRELTAKMEGLEGENEGHRRSLETQRTEQTQTRQRRDAVPESYRRGMVLERADMVGLESEFRLKREALEKVFSESGYPEGIKVAEQAQGRAEDAYHGYVTKNRLRDEDVKAAKDLHPDLSTAVAAQIDASESAKQALTLADSEFYAANVAYEKLPVLVRDQRSTLHPEWPTPTTRAKAEEAASLCRSTEQKARTDRDTAQAGIASHKESLAAAKAVASALQPWVGELDRRTTGIILDAGHPGFRPEPESAPAFLERIRDEVDAHVRGRADADRRADEMHRTKIMAVLADPQFANARMESRARLAELAQVRSQFDHQLPDIIASLASRLEVIAHSQAAIDAERDIVMTAMERRGSTAISLLRSAQSLSEMPAEIKAWAGHCFMKFTIPEKREPTERRIYLRRLLDYWISANVAIPSGHHMAFDCLLALVGSLDAAGKPQTKGSITVEILKPEAHLRYYYHDILAMRTFSGGELVTAAIVLYCVMARLRAKRRGADTQIMGKDSGFLLLDNPVGKANLPDFLDLQIRIANIVGVQYICGTGINDIEALGAFPKVIRLRNSSISRSGAYVVKLEKEQFNPVDAVAIAAKTPLLATAKVKEAT